MRYNLHNKDTVFKKVSPFLSQWPCLEPYRAAFLDDTLGRHRPTNGRKCCLGRPFPRLWDGARGTPRLDPWEREIISLLCLWFHLCKRRALRTPINSPRSPTKPAGFASSVAKGFSGRFGKTDLWCWKETNFTFLKKRLVLGCFLYCHYLIDTIVINPIGISNWFNGPLSKIHIECLFNIASKSIYMFSYIAFSFSYICELLRWVYVVGLLWSLLKSLFCSVWHAKGRSSRPLCTEKWYNPGFEYVMVL